MNDKTLRILEFEKIIDMLKSKASSSIGKVTCESLMPSFKLYDVKERLEETREALDIVLQWGSLPFDGVRNIESSVKRAKLGFVLTPSELLDIAGLLRCTKSLKTFFEDGSKNESYPITFEMVDTLVYIKNLREKIEEIVIGTDEVSDRASDLLFSLRRSIRDKNSRIKEKLQGMISSHGKYLQDPIITIRGDRYVIPVKAECKGNVPGLVHDQSSSGSTLFIEPMAIVEMNNQIKELSLKEKAEVERILNQLSRIVEENADHLLHNNTNIGYLDFIISKGKLALDMGATIPMVNDKGIIDIKEGRHPLIDRDKVVASDIRLGKEFNCLVITGPNTGGKTVTLKTTGLLTLMAMSGLAVPANDGSTLSIFNKVFADIGDEQSIEQSLSTFSSHMVNIVDIINNVDSSSLVLVDELGAGTDPTEGATLAMAIMQNLYEKGAKIIATTHYSEIKVFAMERAGFENASVEFNIETLRPTYRLLIGIPGKSNAFNISKRLGLSENIIEEAKSMISKDEANFEDVIQSLQDKTIQAQKQLSEAEGLREEVNRLKKELAMKQEKIDEKRDKILEKSKKEAQDILRNAKEEADRILRELNEIRSNAKSASMKDAERARRELGSKLDEASKNKIGTSTLKVGMQAVKSVMLGDEVYVSTVGQKGIVMSLPDSKGMIQVQVGVMKMTVAVKNLAVDTAPKKQTKKTGVANMVKTKANKTNSSIDLRGYMVDEAIYEIDKYLDDAFLAGYDAVQIIHGKGTGALRKGVQEHLKRHHYVKSMRIGGFDEGGAGVTVVEIKK
ncbi:endonuclease MutS2 [Clostridium cylindrosporum]|uniref:Endonuclease MutS2 n=1 Tax=Clostridium cylindrosporum DSM 605 TaxID=1121307 RepID=A0A0J8G4P8_CLOCY|nr:endonuclease MutS2 [Clostridium cylindrosporum]KMT22651.1 endonuclease MutS2 [Clostridium cylindrosporum DSM 605]